MTPKQRAAVERNHMIMRLRGVYATLRALEYYCSKSPVTIVGNMMMVEARQMIDAVDRVLDHMGAETEAARKEQRRRALVDF